LTFHRAESAHLGHKERIAGKDHPTGPGPARPGVLAKVPSILKKKIDKRVRGIGTHDAVAIRHGVGVSLSKQMKRDISIALGQFLRTLFDKI